MFLNQTETLSGQWKSIKLGPASDLVLLVKVDSKEAVTVMKETKGRRRNE